MKAWYVTLNDCDSAYVLAETRGKATMAAIREWPETWDHEYWREVRCKRRPELDGDALNETEMLLSGHVGWASCPCCGGRTYPDTAQRTTAGGIVCSKSKCLEQAERNGNVGPWTFGPGRPLMLSTED